ncbi:hypothetical protein [Aquimarina macrocephali]|uniref:hypothetical protein n=1 Tax=Aquimarina macrocephali TaxID=666563 RepID=UPI0004657B99|nr:hypothetical protein [Aquimarina macrocephali]
MDIIVVNILKKIHFRIVALLFVFLLSNSSLFSQNILGTLQGSWELIESSRSTICRLYISNKTNPKVNEQNCQIRLIENKFFLYQNSKEIDSGNFDTEHNYDDVYVIRFHSLLTDEFLKTFNSNELLLFINSDKELLLIENSHPNIQTFVLRKII